MIAKYAKANIITKTTSVTYQGATTVSLADASGFPAAPNYATLINYKTNDYETIAYTGISGNRLTGCTRAIEGVAREWDASTSVGRFLTAIEWNDIVDRMGSMLTYTPPAIPDTIALLDAEGKIVPSNLLPGSMIKVAGAPMNEDELVIFMATLEYGIYNIRTLRNGNEILMTDYVTVTNIETEQEEQQLKYARYLANGTSYEWNEGFKEWVMAAGGGGGGGDTPGGGTVTPIRLYTYPRGIETTFGATLDEPLILSVQYMNSQISTGTLRVYRNTNLILSKDIGLGVTAIDLSNNFYPGKNTYEFKVSDPLGNTATVSYIVTGVTISVTSTFSDTSIQGQDVNIIYNVAGEGTRTAIITLDGVTTEKAIRNPVNILTLTDLAHGEHPLSIQVRTVLQDGTVIFSNKLIFNILVQEVGNPLPVISSKFQDITITQGTLLSIDYLVYKENRETLPVELFIDGVLVGSIVADKSRHYWNVTNLDVGVRELTISCLEVSKTFTVNVTAIGIDFLNVEDDFLKLYLQAGNKTNSDVDKNKWENSYGDPVDVFLEGFNYTSNGWLDQGLVLSGLSTVNIKYKPFAFEVPEVGMTIEFELETKDDYGRDKVFLSCMHGGRGFEVLSDRILLKSSDTTVISLFKENQKLKVSFVINPYEGTTTTYINGVMSGLDRLSLQSAFKQLVPQDITVNNDNMGGRLFNVRIYNRALSHHEVLQNYLYDMVSMNSKIAEYNASDIYDDSGNVDVAKVQTRIPVMVIRTYGVGPDGHAMPQSKDYKPKVDMLIEHPFDPTKNFSASDVTLRTQGTSTLQYPVKNYRLILPEDITYSIDAEKTRPTHILNIKTDYMESSMSTNVGLSRLIEHMYDAPVPVQVDDPLVRVSTYGYPMAVFNNDGISTKFIGLYNLNTDKSDPQTFGHYEGSGYPDSRKFEVLFNAEDHAVAFVKNPAYTEEEWFAEVCEGFEGNYPKQDEAGAYTMENYQPLMDMIGFVSSYVDVAPEGIEAYKAEFLKRIDFDYACKYMLTAFIVGAVDSFGKDLMVNTWGVENGEFYKWYLTFYDLDTCLGIDNQGKMVNTNGEVIYDYDMELEDAVFAQASSRLWEILFTLFPEEVAAKYASMRDTDFTFANIWKHLNEYQVQKFSKGMYNANAISKYVEAPGSSAWIWMLNGDRTTQIERWLTNRLAFLDAKYGYHNDIHMITARISASNLSQFTLTVTPDIHYWVSMKVGNSDSGFDRQRTKAGVPVTMTTSYGETPASFMELNIHNGQHIVGLGDIGSNAAYDLNRLNLTDAITLRTLDLSKPASSTVFDELTLGDNTQLEVLNLRNNAALGGPLDLSRCTNLKSLDLRGTSYTSISLPEGGVLEECHFPSTTINVILHNQIYLTSSSFTIEDGAELSVVRIENTPGVDALRMLDLCTPNANVRITGLEMGTLNNGAMDFLYSKVTGKGGISIDGILTDRYVLYGNINVLKSENFDETIYAGYFPELTITYHPFNNAFVSSQTQNEDGSYSLVGYTGASTFVEIPPAMMRASFDLGTEGSLYSYGFDTWNEITRIAPGVFGGGIYTVSMEQNIKTIAAGAFTENYIGYIATPMSSTPIGWDIGGIEVIHNQVENFFVQNQIVMGRNASGLMLTNYMESTADYSIPADILIGITPTQVYRLGNKFFSTYKEKLFNLYVPGTVSVVAPGFAAGLPTHARIWVSAPGKPAGWADDWTDGRVDVLYNAPTEKRTFNLYDENGDLAETIYEYGISQTMEYIDLIGYKLFTNEACTVRPVFPYYGNAGVNTLYTKPIGQEEFFTFDSATGTITSYGIGGGIDVIIPDEIDGVPVIAIGDGAFKDVGIYSVEFGANVATIGNQAFYGNNLTKVKIVESVLGIGDEAFKNNPDLSWIDVMRASPITSLGTNSFDGTVEGRTIGVPNGTVGIYQAAPNWYYFTDEIKHRVPTEYTGEITPLGIIRKLLAATTVGDYALFGGGSGTSSNIVDAYDNSLVRTIATPLSVGSHSLVATTVGDYALFAGGYNTTRVNAYDSSLVRTIATSLNLISTGLAATTVGDYALFAGKGNVDSVNAYDSALVRTIATPLSLVRDLLAATTVGDYALFAGGNYVNTVDAYDSALVRTIATPLSLSRYSMGATTVGDYALFAGGTISGTSNDSNYKDIVDAYDSTLVKTIATPLNSNKFNSAATTVGGYALFGGGQYSWRGYGDNVIVAYDITLVRTIYDMLSSHGINLAATTVGDYALFAGGSGTDVVDAYYIY